MTTDTRFAKARLAALLALLVAISGCTSMSPDASPAQLSVLRQTQAPALYELAYSTQQHAVFVASAGGTGENARLTRVLRLDPDTLDLQTEIALPAQGFGVTLDDVNHRLYVGNALEAAITVIDTRTNQVTNFVRLAENVQMPDGKGATTARPPHNLRELVLDRARHRLFAPGIWYANSALYVFDTQAMALEKVIPGFGFGAAGVTLDAQAGKVYVSNLQGQLFKIDAASLVVEQTFEVAADQLLNLAFDAARRRILAVDQGAPHIDGARENIGGLSYAKRGEGNRVVVINPDNGAVERSIPTGAGPVNLLLDAQRDRLYVTNRGAGAVAVYNAADNYRLLHTVALPEHPNSLTLDARTGTVFVTVKAAFTPAMTSTRAESVARIAF